MQRLAHLSPNDSVAPTVASPRRSLSRLLEDARGAALLEYSILIGCVSLAGCVGLVVVGVALLDSFEFVRRLVLVPTP